MKTRTGKIARLPREVREELNLRLERPEPGPQILAWLNGEPVTKQNLSHWRQGGFRNWLTREDLRLGLEDFQDFPEVWGKGLELDVIDKGAAFLAVPVSCRSQS